MRLSKNSKGASALVQGRRNRQDNNRLLSFFMEIKMLNKKDCLWGINCLKQLLHCLIYCRYSSAPWKTDVSEPRVRRKTDDVPAATDQCWWVGGANRHTIGGEAEGEFPRPELQLLPRSERLCHILVIVLCKESARGEMGKGVLDVSRSLSSPFYPA